jgi:hypothetical protein
VSNPAAPAWDAAPRKTQKTVRPRAEYTPGHRLIRGVIATFAVLALLLVSAVGALWVRLSHGSIPLDAFAPTLARAIASELSDHTVKVDGLDLELDAARVMHLALRQIQIADPDGQVVAVAPRARITISGRALRRGAFAPERIDLVSPRVLLHKSDDGRVTVRAQATLATATNTPASAPADTDAGAPLAGPSPWIRALADVSERARKRDNAGGYLRGVSLTQAVVVVASGDRRTVWNLPELQLDLDHRRGRSEMAARATFASLTGPWSLTATTREADASKTVDVDVTVDGLNPRGIARVIPALVPFERLDLPLTGTAKLTATTDGRVLRADVDLAGDAAVQRFADRGASTSLVDRAALSMAYEGATGRFSIGKLMLGAGGGEVSLRGSISPPARGDASWIYALTLAEGRLPPPTPGASAPRLDHFAVQGRVDPVAGQAVLSSLALKSGGAEVTATGQITRTPAGPEGTINGRIGAMSAAQFMTLWPESLASPARAWVAAHVTKGAVTAGAFKVGIEAGSAADGAAQTRSTLTLETAGIDIKLFEGWPALELPRALVRVDGGSLDVSAPEGAMAGADGRKLGFRGGRFQAAETIGADQPTGELSFRVTGPLATALELADRPAFQVFRSRGLSPAGIDGRIEGPVRLLFPLANNLQASEVRPDAKLRVTDLRGRNLPIGVDVSGGTLSLEADDKALDVKGDILAKSVNAKVNWQYVFNSPAAQQAPVRLTATLDNADRASLGLDVADLVQGETPVEVTVAADGSGQTRVRVDLTRAEVLIEPIAFRKATGRPAILHFEPVRVPGAGGTARTALQNIRLSGDDVALEGSLVLGPDNKAREFSLPVFSVNVVSRLEVQGKLRPADRVWDIRAKGPTFDGRPMFRALFDLGRPPGATPKPGERSGFDITAEIDTVLGFTDTTLRAVKLSASRREDRLTALDVKGTLEGGKPFAALIRQQPGVGRQLLAEGADAGQVFKLVGFYPSAVGGLMQLEVNLDGRGVNEQSGTLWARDFAVLGDPVASEVFQNADQTTAAQPNGGGRGGRPRVVRSRFDFDGMRIPFSVGQGQFVMNDAVLRGPLIGATMRGRIDFRGQTVNVGGTYVPASALNSAIGGILGPLSGGPQGEGLFGITFAVQGPIEKPQVIVNPLSLLTPGIFREIMQMTPETFTIQQRDAAPGTSRAGPRAGQGPSAPATRASSAPASEQRAPAPAAAPPSGVAPEVSSDWQGAVKREPARQP